MGGSGSATSKDLIERSALGGQEEKGDSNVKTTRRLHSSEWFGIAQGGTGGFCLLGIWFWATMLRL